MGKPLVPGTKNRRPVLQLYLNWTMLRQFRRLAAKEGRSASDYGKILVQDHLRQKSGAGHQAVAAK